MDNKLVTLVEGLLENTLGVVACEEKRAEVKESIKHGLATFFWGREIAEEDRAWKEYQKQKQMEEKVLSFPTFERFEFELPMETTSSEEVKPSSKSNPFTVIDGGRK